MASQKSKFPFLRTAIFLALGVALTWQVLAHSLVAHLAEASPETALSLRSDDPTTLITVSDRKLNLEYPSKEKPAALPAGDASNRIPSFARHARKVTGSEAEQDRTEGALDQAKEPPGTSERLRSNASDPELRGQVGALAQTALAQDPMNARALRILGQIADAANEAAAASKLMQAAVDRSRRESIAVFWLMRESLERKDFAAVVQHADVLLRTRPQVGPQVTPTLARIAEDKNASIELKKMLATNPPWRAAFFSTLMRNITDARTPLELLLSLKDTPTPPTTGELREYLALLMRHHFYEFAYYVWLQFLPQDQLASAGLLFNGDFESRPSGLPFDWAITAGSGVTIDLARRPDDASQRALLVEFGHGRADFRGVAQYVMLAPGSYIFKGQYRGQLVGRRGLEWRISCAGAEIPLAKTAMVTGAAPAWTEFSIRFVVPYAECRAQQVRLALDARSASEQLVTGSIWYDKLQIARAP